ncbi:MAG: ATP-dependent helicase [Tepidisphaeraceae bacterium]
MEADLFSKLNDAQRAAAHAGPAPLLIIAGAGTGKTNTLAHRVAHLIHSGTSPSRILLLTFTRRAAVEMMKRVEGILRGQSNLAAQAAAVSRMWGGTFHAMANRLLRLHAQSIGFNEAFSVLDRSDAEDLMNEVRSELGLDKGETRFPRKETCLSIYSRCVNAQEPIGAALERFPWCGKYPDPLKQLFKAYTQRKNEQNLLDYDDLLLYWFHLMQDEALAADVRGRFDAVLVDEYQDTNALQAKILAALCPEGRGLTVVGDDAQSIYSFRAASVDNILDFPRLFVGTQVVRLEQNYRSVQPILDATNDVIALAKNRFEKNLFTQRRGGQQPRLVTVLDEDRQNHYVIQQILAHHEAGIDLKKQAVLFRAAHHSDTLEVELARRNIPFVKYGGLKFLEAAHVKDLLSILRLADNPTDSTSAFRVLQLLDGIGPSHARKAIQHLASRHHDLDAWLDYVPPAAASGQWDAFAQLLIDLRTAGHPLPEQVKRVREFYAPILEKRYDAADARRRDLEQLEQVSANFENRTAMLAELTLDPPASTQDLAGPPLREEDCLVLSTIHSAKGCEWDAVYVIHAADGNIPSDMATGSEAEIEEERRLFYVALTRAKDFLEVVLPLKYYAKGRGTSDRHSYAQVTRFIPEAILPRFERVRLEPTAQPVDPAKARAAGDAIRSKIASLWD